MSLTLHSSVAARAASASAWRPRRARVVCQASGTDRKNQQQNASLLELGPIGLTIGADVHTDDGSSGNGSGEPSTRPKSYAELTTAEWQERYEKDGTVDLWLQEEFNSGSRLVGGSAVYRGGVAGQRSGEGPGRADAQSFKVKIINHYAEQEVEVEVPEDRYILFAAEEEGLELPYACRLGCCTSCTVKVKEGEMYQPQSLGLSKSLREQGYALMCVGYPMSDLVLETVPEDEAYELQFGRAFDELAVDPNAPSVERDDFAIELAMLDDWKWRGHSVKFITHGCGPPVVLVHGFGASSLHWRNNIEAIAEAGYKVYAPDLLGLGASEKPLMDYEMEVWRDQLIDFMSEFVQHPAVLVGNSIGSLACLMVAEAAPNSVSGVALLNCAGGMNNKAISDDWRIRLALPFFYSIDWLLRRRSVAQNLFDRFRKPDNIAGILRNVYGNKAAVDAELVQIIYQPSCDPGALDAFVSIITGPPGPRPDMLLSSDSLTQPLLVIWGDNDPMTPANGPVGRFFQALPATRPDTTFHFLKGVGHCPHDDAPDLTHTVLLPWLDRISRGRYTMELDCSSLGLKYVSSSSQTHHQSFSDLELTASSNTWACDLLLESPADVQEYSSKMLEPGFQLPQQELLDLLASRLDFQAVFPATPRACWMDDASAVTTAGLALQLAKAAFQAGSISGTLVRHGWLAEGPSSLARTPAIAVSMS
ncbi:Ferredoxin C 2 [Chlorella vulgaris]